MSGQKIIDGLDEALAFVRCQHDWGAWHHCGTGSMKGKARTRVCRKCRVSVTECYNEYHAPDCACEDCQ